jgi:hypothetical protein
MKRSEINALLEEAKQFFQDHHFHLPRWAFWGPADWKGRRKECAQIIDRMLGWDITDFASGDYRNRGLLLFALRNGTLSDDTKNYAEKIMIVKEDQETPFHFHWSKMEDIINRGGGNLILELFLSTEDEKLSDEPVPVIIDGVEHIYKPGERVRLEPGESITLYQGLYHRFYAEPGRGWVLCGEVSSVNDDTKDNRFLEGLGRFPALDEDADPIHLLVADYEDYL